MSFVNAYIALSFGGLWFVTAVSTKYRGKRCQGGGCCSVRLISVYICKVLLCRM